MEKLDEALAARQIAWLASLVTRPRGGVVLEACTTHGDADRIELELLRGSHRIGRVRAARLTRAHRRLVLRAGKLTPGMYTLAIKASRRVRARRRVRLG